MKIRLLMSYSRWLLIGKRLVGGYSRRPLTFERLSARTSPYVCCCCWVSTENYLPSSLSSLSTVYTVHHPRHQGRWTTYWPIVSTHTHLTSFPLPSPKKGSHNSICFHMRLVKLLLMVQGRGDGPAARGKRREGVNWLRTRSLRGPMLNVGIKPDLHGTTLADDSGCCPASRLETRNQQHSTCGQTWELGDEWLVVIR